MNRNLEWHSERRERDGMREGPVSPDGGDAVNALQAVLEVVERERAAVAAGDLEAYSSVLAVGAAFMPPNDRTKSGEDLRRWLGGFLKDFRVEWLGFESTEVRAAEDLAYHGFTYTWRVTARSGGEGKVSSGKGLHILRREEDGRWRIWREIWNGLACASPTWPRHDVGDAPSTS